MTTFSTAPVLALVLALSLAACTDDTGATSATDPAPAGSSPAAPRPPSAVPAAPGSVRSTALPTVMDTGGGAELCLGAIAESYPPQCGGPPITNWDWASAGIFDRQAGVRWGTFAVTGTWDGEAFTVAASIPGPLYDTVAPPPVELPRPSVDHSAEELDAISSALVDELPGYLASSVDRSGHVLVDVVYDDGTLQDYTDEAYGPGVIVVRAALADAEG